MASVSQYEMRRYPNGPLDPQPVNGSSAYYVSANQKVRVYLSTTANYVFQSFENLKRANSVPTSKNLYENSFLTKNKIIIQTFVPNFIKNRWTLVSYGEFHDFRV